MKTDEVEVPSPSCEGERASERTAAAEFDAKMRDAEIARLEKAQDDLVKGFQWLHHMKPAPWDLRRRLATQVGRLRAVERKLFNLRQRRLL